MKQLKDGLYQVQVAFQEKELAYNKTLCEVQQLNKKTERAKASAQRFQKSVKRMRKSKSKLDEEVGNFNKWPAFIIQSWWKLV